MGGNEGGSSSSSVLRDYRKGNWTVEETIVLIEAKKKDDERRMKRDTTNSKAGELRWKWVEDYCWRKGCFRSQNQCNDKWDNLMRDFKKVRDYERSVSQESESYWNMEKHERKQRNLPSNMLPQLYRALLEVVERKAGLRVVERSTSAHDTNINVPQQLQLPPSCLPPPTHLQNPCSAPPPLLPLPPPPPPPPPPPQPYTLPHSQPHPTADFDTSAYSSESPAKRRRKGRGGGGGEGSSGSTSACEVGKAISKSASIIAEAIHDCEGREERRHRDLLSLHQRRLDMEESNTELTRQGLNALADAINKLANSILNLASQKAQSFPK